MSDIKSGSIGSAGKYDVAFTDGKIVVSASIAEMGADANISISISGKTILDAIAAKIGGPIPAEIVSFLELSLGIK